jgi:alpha-mannosidase
MAPLDRIEDYHNLTWGAIGYGHLDESEKQGQSVLDASLRHIAGQIRSADGKGDQRTVTVFNPCAWERTDIATTGRIYPIPENIRGVVVKHHTGRVVLSQIIESHKNEQGDLLVAEVSFVAEKLPSLGYDTYYLEFTAEGERTADTDLKVDERQFTLENKHLKIRIDENHGAIASLIDKTTGQEMLKAGTGAFPHFTGTPNQEYTLYTTEAPKWHQVPIPKSYDSFASDATYTWVDKGPLRATLKTRQEWPLLAFETWISLYAGSPAVEVTTRVLAEIPPAVDAYDSKDHFPVEIKEGYWLTFAPNFETTSVVRDFPLGMETTKHDVFQGRTFVDLIGKDSGLLVLHPGTQYFKREGDGTVANLVMREWESFYSREYGWPRYSEYRHLLRPHGKTFSNADRARSADEFSQKLITVVDQTNRSGSGSLPPAKSFVTVTPESAHLMVFRKKESQGFELRTLEIGGAGGQATVHLDIPVASASETNLLGVKVAGVSAKGNKLMFDLHPWKLNTLEIF